MAQDAPVRVGIIGAGGFTNTHMEEFAKVDGVEVVAFCRRDPGALAEMQSKWSVGKGYTDYRELLADGEIDAVDIVTPTDSHHPLAMDAIAAGKHVLCDKPLALTAQQCKEMLEAAEKAGVAHCTNFNQRGRTPVGQMKQLIDDGYLGDIYHMNIWWGQSQAHDIRPDATPWRFRAESGGGTIYELIHAFDMALFLGGSVRRVAAIAPVMETNRPLPGYPNGMDCDAPDSSAFLMEFETGAYAVIHTSFISRGLDDASGTHVHLDIAGSSGRLRNDGLTTIKGINGLGNRDVLSDVPTGPAYPQPYAQFVGAILTGEPVKSSFAAGLEAARLRDAAQLAADEERWVALS